MMESLIYKERKNTDCAKWDGLLDVFGQEDLLSAWVADMDFESPQCVKNALSSLVEHNIYGYYHVPDRYYDAIIHWEQTRHDCAIRKEWIRHIPGVVPCIYWLINILTAPRDPVLIMPPVYYPFKNAVTQTDRTPLTCPLLNQNGYYTIDFARFEQTIIQERVKAFILCSPHNPVGRIWKKEELCTILQICKDHGVFVISDEIHHDLEMPGYKHIPSMSVGNYSDILFTLFSASKTFNLAGFQSAILIIENPDLRERFDDFTCRIHLAVDYGDWFGGSDYDGFIRINLATSHENIIEMTKRLSRLMV